MRGNCRVLRLPGRPGYHVPDMLIGTLYKVGNALVLAIPRALQRELSLHRGTHVVMRTDHDGRITIEELVRYVDSTRAHRADATRAD